MAPAARSSSPLASAGQDSGPLSEEELTQLWEGQRFPPQALMGRDGLTLRVIYRGRRQRGSGPDFRDAIIATRGGLLVGDVELHVRASDFRRHGHHLDPAFDQVILHLVFWDDEGADTLLVCGRRVPVVALAPWVARRAQEIGAWLEGPPRWEEPCRSALKRLGSREVARILDKLGDLRFRQKVVALAREVQQRGAEEVLYQRLWEALGYSQNREPFLALAQALPWQRLRASLLAVPPGQRMAEAQRTLLAAAAGLNWRTRGLRPGNGPFVRLAGAAALAARYAETGLLAGLMEVVAQGAEEPDALLAALTVKEGPVASIGKGRAGELALNVVLPLAVAWGDRHLASVAESLYRRWPRTGPYGITAHLDQALNSGKGDGIRVGARRQQGMLYLFHHYCRRGGCGRCPLS